MFSFYEVTFYFSPLPRRYRYTRVSDVVRAFELAETFGVKCTSRFVHT